MSGSLPTTNVPDVIFGPNGFVAPAESAILAGTQADINADFGGTLSQNLETPQGQLASSLAAIIGDKNNTFLQYVNGVDPKYNSGRMQDGIARIYFLNRIPAAETVVQCQIGGQAGVTIPVGALAQDELGNTYSCTLAVTIPDSGVIDTYFANTQFGPIECAIGTLNKPYSIINGWDTITNPTAGVVGQYEETAAAFEIRREQSVALNALGVMPAIQANVLAVPNVIDCYVLDNSQDTPVTIGGVTLAANSLFVSVSGGLAADVANAIWLKKQPGCSYSGTTTVVVTDPSPSYTTPPQYNVSFTEASQVSMYFSIVLLASGAIPDNAATLIQTAILNAFAGLDGGPRARIGATLLATRYIGAVVSLGAWAQVVSLQIALGTSYTLTASITGNTLNATVVTSSISVGDLIQGPGVTPGTLITSVPAGGGPGAYGVNKTQNVVSVGMTGTTFLNSLSVPINVSPTLDASNIIVNVS